MWCDQAKLVWTQKNVNNKKNNENLVFNCDVCIIFIARWKPHQH